MIARRLLLAALVLLCAINVHAATATITGKATCAYAQIIADAGGNVTVTCADGPTPPPPTPDPTPTPIPTPVGCTDGPWVPVPGGSLGISGHGNTIPLASGSVGSVSLPNPTGPINSGQIIMTEGTGGPVGAVVVELAISPCRGAVEAQQSPFTACYSMSNVATTSSLLWAFQAVPGQTPAMLEGFGVCPIYLLPQPWYFNLRYTYATCNFGTCSYIVEWYNGWF